jgi:hypothetical protein
MRLETAGKLKDVGVLLMNMKIPFAFGGRIFNELPELPSKIPGYFLGEAILESIPKVEDLLTGSYPQITHREVSGENLISINNFKEAQPSIDAQVMKWARSKFSDKFLLDYIDLANKYLGTDITTALSLGDIKLLNSNVKWLGGLLLHRGLKDDLLHTYLKTYREIVKTTFDSYGLNNAFWLTEFIHILDNDGVKHANNISGWQWSNR